MTDIRDTQIDAEIWAASDAADNKLQATQTGAVIWNEHGRSPLNRILVPQTDAELWISRASIPTEIICPQMTVEVWVSTGSGGAGTSGRRRILMAEY